jgi:hypothetical protein
MSNTPAHVILLPNDNLNIINFMNFDDIGISTLKDASSFRKIQFFSKTDPYSLFGTKSDFETSFAKISSLYKTDQKLVSSMAYGTKRQHNYNSLLSVTPITQSTIDNYSVNQYFSYNLNTKYKSKPTSFFNSSDNENFSFNNTKNVNNNIIKMIPYQINFNPFNIFTNNSSNFKSLMSSFSIDTDSQKVNNDFKYLNSRSMDNFNISHKD